VDYLKRRVGSRKNVPPGVIEVNLRDLSQLFNSMDPAPFHDKDLDADAEAFIESWALEYPLHTPLKLVVHLPAAPDGQEQEPLIRTAVENFFAHKADLAHRELTRLLRTGRLSLLIGILFLTLCLETGEILSRFAAGTAIDWVKEGLLIAGWVAMWRPMEIYLYGWWPVLRKVLTYAKLSRMSVEVRVKPPPRE
jgi:hypothetical protein